MYPAHGIVPDLCPLLDAPSIARAFNASAALRDQQVAGTEAFAASQAKEMRALQKDLVKKGVDFDVDRLLHGTVWDRIVDKWYDVIDWFQREPPPTEADPSFEIVIGLTRETSALPFDYDVIFGESRRLKTGVAEQITAACGSPPRRLDIQWEAPEHDDWDDTEMLRSEMADFDMLWPPVRDKPGFALAERQEDGGLPIEIVLLVCSAETYDQLVALA